MPMIIDAPIETVQPKSSHNPLGDIAIHERWSTADEALFANLCIERGLKEEVYLAAYLACWLCVFVLPSKDVNSIRPSTFNMESLMASGRRVASMCEGLNTIATSPKPASTSPSIPIHFVYAWEVQSIMTHEQHASEYIRPSSSRGLANMLVKEGPFKFVDDGNAEELDQNYFFAICSSYLTLCQDDKFIIEPYSPHRFRHQFGPKSIKITLKCKTNEDKQVDSGENNPPHVFVPPVVIKCDSQAAVVEASKGKEFLQKLWSGLLVKISNTPVDFLSSIEDDVYLIPESMKSFHKFNVSKVEESLNTFFVKVGDYDKARSLSSEKLSPSFHKQQLKKAKARVQDVQAKASVEASKVQSAMNELEHIEKEIIALKGRRTNLRATLKGKKQLNHDAQAKVHEVKKDIAALESTDPLDHVIMENLEPSRASLEILKKDLKSLNPFA
ncbi:hypothetical protein Sango_1265500 [Sesamum angolense]|uniref:Aminotransferase-like plant mobile domain-containing protein n=1 Tax=Sesamum angolense TaxID=2727404 RepID=A0AAE1WQZ9_9LAMI|nr:hypothetical protein Sango_1265500 [Sesamum angolense]